MLSMRQYLTCINSVRTSFSMELHTNCGDPERASGILYWKGKGRKEAVGLL